MEYRFSDSNMATFAVTASAVRDYAAAIGAKWEGAEQGVPSTLASVFTYAAVAAMPIKAGVVLTGQEFDFHAPLHIGDELVTSFEVTDTFERRERKFMVITTETRNQHADLVVVGRITRLLPDVEGAS